LKRSADVRFRDAKLGSPRPGMTSTFWVLSWTNVGKAAALTIDTSRKARGEVLSMESIVDDVYIEESLENTEVDTETITMMLLPFIYFELSTPPRAKFRHWE
jgi:hypothetical protein